MLQYIIDYVFFIIFDLDRENRLVQILNFFIYDSIKILLLLFIMIGIIGVIRTYIPINKLKIFLVKRRVLGSFGASLFGAITPFCSCSSVPIFISFIKARVPIGAAFAFLITSPLVNEYLVVIMFAEFGLKITILYVVAGILIGVVAGNIIQAIGAEKYISVDIVNSGRKIKEIKYRTFKSRIEFGLNEARSIVRKLWIWVLVGVGIGAIIHNVIPTDTLQKIISSVGILDVPIATLLGIPIYASCAAIVPIAVVLLEKGVPLGTSIAFMMGASALSLPEAVILRRVMRLKLILIFFGVVAVGIIFIGYLLNIFQGILI